MVPLRLYSTVKTPFGVILKTNPALLVPPCRGCSVEVGIAPLIQGSLR